MKKLYILTTSFFALLFLYSNVFAGGDATFGLKWGMSPVQLKKLNITLEFVKSDNNMYFYRTKSLPKNIADVDFYSLIFDEDKSLVKITMYSKNITKDPAGIEGKEKFAKLESSLKKKYKLLTSFKKVGVTIYDKFDEFYQCLAYELCGLWIITLEGPNKSIIMELVGQRRGEGYIRLMVEAVPEFRQTVEKLESIKTKKDDDAL